MVLDFKDQIKKMEKEYFKSKNAKSILKKIQEWSDSYLNQEVCGFIGKSENKYTAFLCENKSSEPEHSFTIDPMEYYLFLKDYSPIAVWHSHVYGDEEESEKDVLMSENSCLPFFIYSLNTKKMNFYTPLKSSVEESELKKFKNIND